MIRSHLVKCSQLVSSRPLAPTRPRLGRIWLPSPFLVVTKPIHLFISDEEKQHYLQKLLTVYYHNVIIYYKISIDPAISFYQLVPAISFWQFRQRFRSQEYES
jgi:hypothetical protein